ncbi:hypothetical protein R1flu_010071 [Riccia fluitans]|uniref:Sugar Porter n=1 Tax=Riccia fluitans TaxID=41844 RepID=A0ABD1Z6H4_9MARC
MKLFRPSSSWSPVPEKNMDLSLVGVVKEVTFDASRAVCDGKIGVEGDTCSTISSGMWVLPSFLTHSCVPNTEITFFGKAMFLRSSRDLEAGEELTTSYTACSNLKKSIKEWYLDCTCEWWIVIQTERMPKQEKDCKGRWGFGASRFCSFVKTLCRKGCISCSHFVLLRPGEGSSQVVPLYLSELSPTYLRGALNMMFQLATTIGILMANLINFGTAHVHPWGWRLSLGLAIVPASVLTLGGLFLPETPNSLIEHQHLEKGRVILQRIRGVEDVDKEFSDLLKASRIANQVEHPFRNLLQPRNRPQLVMAIFLPFFQIATGINSILFYAPQGFQTIGFGSNTALYSSIIIGAILSFSTLVGLILVDKVGRKKLFYIGGIQMFIMLVSLETVMWIKLDLYNTLDKEWAALVVILMCTYVAGFGWSWGSLGWTVPSEIFPQETRSAGQSIVVLVNFIFTFLIGQNLLSMLCHFKYGTFYFFSGTVFLMTIFVALFLIETKDVHLEDMPHLWAEHWFWKHRA